MGLFPANAHQTALEDGPVTDELFPQGDRAFSLSRLPEAIALAPVRSLRETWTNRHCHARASCLKGFVPAILALKAFYLPRVGLRTVRAWRRVLRR